jgi:DNA-binding IclR family transcriptional regulator
VRATGIATSDRQVSMDALSVGAPIRDPGGSVVAAVSLVVPAGAHDPTALGKLVATAARGISRSLAGPPVLQPAN